MTRSRTFVPLALCALAAAAAAQAPGPRVVVPPAGWAQQPVQLATPRPDVTSTSVAAYYPPGTPAGPKPAVLYVTRIERKAAPEQRDAIASAELEEIFAAQRRQGASAKTEASARRADPAARQLEAALAWRDASIGMVDSSRVVVAADAQRVVAITGQCLLGAGATAELARACDAALATLDPGIPAAARVPLSMAAEPPPVEPPPAPATAAGPGASRGPATASPRAGPGMGPVPARLDDASRVELPPQPPQLQRSADRRPLYLGLGLVALALLFWWNRQRRQRLEDREERGSARRRRDDDDDDLHAAADEPAAEAEAKAGAKAEAKAEAKAKEDPPAPGPDDRKEKDA